MATTTAATPPATRPGLSRSASVIVTSRRPSLRVKTAREGEEGAAMEGGERGRKQTRPITFALPPSSADTKSPHLTSSLPSSSSANPPPPLSPTTPTSSSFLNRLTRKLSQSRSTLVRRVSIGKGGAGGGGKTGGTGPSSSSAASTRSSSSPPSPVITRTAEAEANKENAPPPTTGTGLTPPRASTSRPKMGKRSLSHTPSTSSALARAARQQAETEQVPVQERTEGGATAGGAPLRRGLRVSVMRRTKSEAKRKGRILNEEGKMDELVRRTEEADANASAGGEGVKEREGGRRGDWEEVHSSMGSYFWSDSLGVCWDGREKVHPDVLFSFQPYSSDSDVLPPHLQNQQNRIVYASTLSSFPPRPPLRPRTPEMTEAGKIIAEWRKVNGTMTPSVHGDEDGEGEEEGLETVVGSEQDTPRPVDGEDEPGPLAATPTEQEPEPALALNLSTSTVRPRPSFAALPASSNPFASPTSPTSSTSPALLAPSPHRPLSSNSFFSAPSTSAYSTPTSEPGQFHFRSGSDGGEEGGEEEGAGEGGVRMSSEGSETSLESIAALATAAKGGRA